MGLIIGMLRYSTAFQYDRNSYGVYVHSWVVIRQVKPSLLSSSSTIVHFTTNLPLFATDTVKSVLVITKTSICPGEQQLKRSTKQTVDCVVHVTVFSHVY